MENILGFIHIGNLGRGKEIFFDQIDLIKSSGLYSKTKRIYVGVAGRGLDFCFIDPKITLLSHDPVLRNGECLLLKSMHKHCQTCEPAKIWYIHTKGASVIDPKNQLYHNQNAWRDYMQYFIIENHEDCIEALNEFDVCGVEYMKLYKYFIGNFWWANSDYIKKIKNPVSENLKKPMSNERFVNPLRYLAEFDFIGKGDPKAKSFHTFGKLMYDYKIPKRSYMKNEKPINEIKLI